MEKSSYSVVGWLFFAVLNILVFVIFDCYYFFTGGMIRDSFIVCFQGCCPPKGREKQQTHGFFDTARLQHGGSYDDKIVDGVIAVLRVLPVFFLLTMYWAVYSQVSSDPNFYLPSSSFYLLYWGKVSDDRRTMCFICSRACEPLTTHKPLHPQRHGTFWKSLFRHCHHFHNLKANRENTVYWYKFEITLLIQVNLEIHVEIK